VAAPAKDGQALTHVAQAIAGFGPRIRPSCRAIRRNEAFAIVGDDYLEQGRTAINGDFGFSRSRVFEDVGKGLVHGQEQVMPTLRGKRVGWHL
jgi:hypothetical protein